MPAWLDKLKNGLGLEAEEEQQEQTLLQQLDEATTLDRTQRMIGFATCVGIGLLLSFMVRMGSPHQCAGKAGRGGLRLARILPMCHGRQGAAGAKPALQGGALGTMQAELTAKEHRLGGPTESVQLQRVAVGFGRVDPPAWQSNKGATSPQQV